MENCFMKSSKNEHVVRFNLGKLLSLGQLKIVFECIAVNFPEKYCEVMIAIISSSEQPQQHQPKKKQINGKLCNSIGDAKANQSAH